VPTPASPSDSRLRRGRESPRRRCPSTLWHQSELVRVEAGESQAPEV